MISIIINLKQVKNMPKDEKPSDKVTEKTGVFSGVKTSFMRKLINKFKKGSKRRPLWIAGAVFLTVLIIAAVFVAWLVLFSPYAVVDGQIITRAQYDSMQSKAEQFYKFNKAENVQGSADKAAKDRLIEEKITHKCDGNYQ